MRPGSVLLLLICTSGAASHGAEPVPIEQEPRHVLKFENTHLRLFDVALEPGYQTLYHWHRNDGVFVGIEPARTVAQDWGGEPAMRGPRAIGETYFIAYASKPKAHRVANSDQREFRVVDAEILSGCGPVEAWSKAPEQTLVLDNERVFVTRIILHPRESAVLYPPCGVLVSVSGGRISLDGPDGARTLELSRAGFQWRDSPREVRLTNAGETVFHAVDIRIKR